MVGYWQPVNRGPLGKLVFGMSEIPEVMTDSHRPAASANARRSEKDSTDDESTRSMVISNDSESGPGGISSGAAEADGASAGAAVDDGDRVGIGPQEPHENPKLTSGTIAHFSLQSIVPSAPDLITYPVPWQRSALASVLHGRPRNVNNVVKKLS